MSLSKKFTIKEGKKAKTEEEKKKVGAPSKYNPKYAAIAKQLCLLGATNENLAKSFEVDPSTIATWMNKNPAFRNAIKAGRENADAQVADALFNRALGYKHKATKLQLDRNGKWQTKDYIEVYPPDATSALFWLKNRQPDKWREKLDIEQKTIIVTVEGDDQP